MPRPILLRLAVLVPCLLLAPWGGGLPAAAQNLGDPATATNSKVVVVHDPRAMPSLAAPVPERIQSMVDRAIISLTGSASLKAAWLSLVSTQDTVGIKVFSTPGGLCGTRPAVVAAVVKDLIAAGVPARQIVVWDRRLVDLRDAGFFELATRFGIRVEGSVEAGYDEKTVYDSPLLGTLLWSDLDYGKPGEGVGRKSHVSKLVSNQLTKIISIVPLMHHNLLGVTGNLYSVALGSVDNTLRFETSADNLSRAIPEIYNLPVLADHVVLNIVDALLCQYEGEQRGLLHYSAELNELWFSRDPVALDVLSLQEINRQRNLAQVTVSTNSVALFPNATLMEIGASDPKRIDVQRLP